METTRIQNGQTEVIENAVALDSSNNPLTGLSDVSLRIRRISDDYFLDFNDNTFKASGWMDIEIDMTEVDSTNDPGKYKYAFDTSGFSDDAYQIRINCSSAENFPQFGEIKVGDYVDNLDAAISSIKAKTDNLPADTNADLQIIQALAGKNSKLFSTTYDTNNNLTDGTIRGYASKADLEADSNHIFELTISATYSGAGKATEHIRRDSA